MTRFILATLYPLASCLGIAGPAMEHAFLLWAREHLQRRRPTGRELPEVVSRIAELEAAR